MFLSGLSFAIDKLLYSALSLILASKPAFSDYYTQIIFLSYLGSVALLGAPVSLPSRILTFKSSPKQSSLSLYLFLIALSLLLYSLSLLYFFLDRSLASGFFSLDVFLVLLFSLFKLLSSFLEISSIGDGTYLACQITRTRALPLLICGVLFAMYLENFSIVIVVVTSYYILTLFLFYFSLSFSLRVNLAQLVLRLRPRQVYNLLIYLLHLTKGYLTREYPFAWPNHLALRSISFELQSFLASVSVFTLIGLPVFLIKFKSLSLSVSLSLYFQLAFLLLSISAHFQNSLFSYLSSNPSILSTVQRRIGVRMRLFLSCLSKSTACLLITLLIFYSSLRLYVLFDGPSLSVDINLLLATLSSPSFIINLFSTVLLISAVSCSAVVQRAFSFDMTSVFAILCSVPLIFTAYNATSSITLTYYLLCFNISYFLFIAFPSLILIALFPRFLFRSSLP